MDDPSKPEKLKIQTKIILHTNLKIQPDKSKNRFTFSVEANFANANKPSPKMEIATKSPMYIDVKVQINTIQEVTLIVEKMNATLC